jgi:hypothetical protein
VLGENLFDGFLHASDGMAPDGNHLEERLSHATHGSMMAGSSSAGLAYRISARR